MDVDEGAVAMVKHGRTRLSSHKFPHVSSIYLSLCHSKLIFALLVLVARLVDEGAEQRRRRLSLKFLHRFLVSVIYRQQENNQKQTQLGKGR